MRPYYLKCSGCNYDAGPFDNEHIARTAAEMHAMLGESHVVTCTHPEHNQTRKVAQVVKFVVRGRKPMSLHDQTRTWTQEELRTNLLSLGFSDKELAGRELPQGVKWMSDAHTAREVFARMVEYEEREAKTAAVRIEVEFADGYVETAVGVDAAKIWRSLVWALSLQTTRTGVPYDGPRMSRAKKA